MKDLEIEAKNFLEELEFKVIEDDKKLYFRHAIVGEVFINDRNLSPCSIKVFLFLSMDAGKKIYTWVSQDIIADGTGYSRKQVNKAIKELKELGYIKYKTFRRENNMEHNLYVLCYSPYILKNQ